MLKKNLNILDFIVLLLIKCFFSLFCFFSIANGNVIYQGIDSSGNIINKNRRVVTNPDSYNSAVAAMVYRESIGVTENNPNQLIMWGNTYSEVPPFNVLFKANQGSPSSANICSNENIASVMRPSKCTAVLIGRDYLLTAGHCLVGQEPEKILGYNITEEQLENSYRYTSNDQVNYMYDRLPISEQNKICQNYLYVFDFYNKPIVNGKVFYEVTKRYISKTGYSVPLNSVFRCESVVYRSYSRIISRNTGNPQTPDFAIIKIAPHSIVKKIQNITHKNYRSPMRYRTSLPRVGENITMMGHALGHSMTEEYQSVPVKNVNTTTFQADLSNGDGSSGSPIISTETGELLGIMVRSFSSNFTYNYHGQCIGTNVCSANGCEQASGYTGDAVGLSMTAIAPYIPR